MFGKLKDNGIKSPVVSQPAPNRFANLRNSLQPKAPVAQPPIAPVAQPPVIEQTPPAVPAAAAPASVASPVMVGPAQQMQAQQNQMFPVAPAPSTSQITPEAGVTKTQAEIEAEKKKLQ